MIDRSEQLKNYAIAAVCVVVCIFFISYSFYLIKKVEAQNKLNEEIMLKVDEVYNDYKLALETEADVKMQIFEKVDEVYNDYKIVLAAETDAKMKIFERSEAVATIINEISLIISTRVLENEDAIGHAEADMMIIDSLKKIQDINPRLADIVSIINREFIRNRR